MQPKPPPTTLDYDSYITGLLAWLSNRLSNGASAVYRRMFGIGVMEWRVMAHLAIEPSATAARIGRIIGLDKAAISRTLTVLTHAKLVTPVAGPMRGRQLALTAAGRALHDRILVVAQSREARLLTTLSAAEQAVLRDLLRRLLRDLPPELTGSEGAIEE